MKRKLGKKNVILALSALALTATLGVGSSMAYFTTYANARGGVKVNLGFSKTIPNDDVDEKGKHVSISNTGDYGCFVRAKIFSVIDVAYVASEGWENGGDGYWYYKPVLEPGQTTGELLVTYTFPADTDPSAFDIVVVQECTPILYTEDGQPYADWSRVITNDSDNQG